MLVVSPDSFQPIFWISIKVNSFYTAKTVQVDVSLNFCAHGSSKSTST